MSERKTPTILVADDDRLMRWALVERLSDEHCEIWEAAEPPSVLALLRKTPDMAIVDVGLVNASGALEDALGAFAHQRPLVVLTSDRDAVLVGLAKARNVKVLEKPLELDHVATLATAALERRGVAVRGDRAGM